MRPILFALLVASLCFGTAIAQDLGNSRELPVKNTPIVIYVPPAVPRQGGDTVDDAFPIDGLPFLATGTTVDFINDYDENCPYSNFSSSPDVVYGFTPSDCISIDVDLCGSSFDTKIYIFDSDLNNIICNDDFYFDDICGVWVSRIEYADLTGGETYFIIIDGHDGGADDYILNVTENVPCPQPCPPDAVDEGEPPLYDGYEDAYNGGCNSPDFGNPFQDIDWINVEGGHPLDGYAWLCGKSGWYLNSQGSEYRDTDWFKVFARETGVMEFTVESEYPCRMFKLAPLECETVAVELEAIADCDGATLSFSVTASEEVWLWVGPRDFHGPVTEFPYFMTVTNNTFDTVPIEGMSWGGVKALYR